MQTQKMYGIVVETLQFSFIYQTYFYSTSVFVSVIKPEINIEYKQRVLDFEVLVFEVLVSEVLVSEVLGLRS